MQAGSGAGAAGTWRQEGEAPAAGRRQGLHRWPSKHRALSKALPPGAGPWLQGQNTRPGAGAAAPALLQPHLLSACALTACPGSTGPAAPAGAFYSCPHCDTALWCHRPRASQPSPARHPQPGSGNSSRPWAPKVPADTKCRPITGEPGEPGNPRAALYKAGTSALPHNPCQSI